MIYRFEYSVIRYGVDLSFPVLGISIRGILKNPLRYPNNDGTLTNYIFGYNITHEKRRNLMVKRFLHICVILNFLLLFGCAKGPLSVNEYVPPKTVSTNYQVILIPNFRKTDLEWVPYDSGSEIAEMVAEQLRTQNKFKVISRSDKFQATGDEKVLLVDGTVSGYTRGCKYCEYIFQGFDDKGKMSVQVRVTLVDERTGDVLADVGIDGRAKPPGYGRSKYYRVVDEIVKVIDTVNSGKS